MRFFVALVGAGILTFAVTALALGYATENVSGLVANDAAWAHYGAPAIRDGSGLRRTARDTVLVRYGSVLLPAPLQQRQSDRRG